MSEDYNKKTPLWFVVLTSAIAVVVVTPIGLSVGTLLGMISDFGLDNTVANIRANPDTFAKQYAQLIVCTGWAALVAIVVLAVVGCVTLIRRYGKPPTKDERQCRAMPDQPIG